MQSQQDRVAWIGLGLLGYELTQHLQKYIASQSLPGLAVWNRTIEKATALQSIVPGIQVATSIDELFSKYKANIVFTSLQNDAIVEQVYEQLISIASNVQYPIVFVETGTLYPRLSEKLEKQISSLPQNHVYLQCPVFGRPEAARLAQMIWVASGDQAAVKRLTPYFNSMSRKVMDLKTTDVKAGSTMKLLGNFMIMSYTELVSESLNIAKKANLDPQHLITFVDEFIPAPAFQQYTRRIVSGAEEPDAVEMTVNIALKDVGALRQWGQEIGVPTPTANLVRENYAIAKEKGLTKNWNYLVDTINSTADNSSEN